MEALVKLGTAAATRKRQSGIRSDQPSSGFERKDIKIPKVMGTLAIKEANDGCERGPAVNQSFFKSNGKCFDRGTF